MYTADSGKTGAAPSGGGFTHRWGQASGGGGAPGGGGNGGTPVPALAAAFGERIGPAYDPESRRRLGAKAKWLILVAVIALIAVVPTVAYYLWKYTEPAKLTPGSGVPFSQKFWGLTMATNTAFFAAVVATGIPRLLMVMAARMTGDERVIRRFQMWREPAEALRDWMIVGAVSAGLYALFVNILKANPAFKTTWGAAADTWEPFYRYRLPLVLISAAVGITLARLEASRRSGMKLRGAGNYFWALVWTLIQMVLMGVLFWPIQQTLYQAFPITHGVHFVPALPFAAGAFLVSIVCAIMGLSIVNHARRVDRELVAMQRKGGTSGVLTGDEPVTLTVTIVGSRNSGKTALLAGAYHEWMHRWQSEESGGLSLVPVRGGSLPLPEGQSRSRYDVANQGGADYDLERIARTLYPARDKGEFPGPTVLCRHLPFDLVARDEDNPEGKGTVVARINFLDYPGGALFGAAPDPDDVRTFEERVAYTDAVVLVADMSEARRRIQGDEYRDVLAKYHDVMNRLALRNGKRRVIPVALVLTKCDEFYRAGTTSVDQASLRQALRDYGYLDLEPTWVTLARDQGPGIAEFSTWQSSAITFSAPGRDERGAYDFALPYQIVNPPPPVTPTGCASPLLWIAAKAMRWNATLGSDLKTFFWGPSPRMRRQLQAIRELERIAEERAHV